MNSKDMSNQELELDEINQIFQAVGGPNSEFSGEHKLRNSVKFLMDSTFKSEMASHKNNNNPIEYVNMQDNYEKESENLIDLITEQIKLQAQTLSEKKHCKRYSPLLLQLATTIYTRSNATYRQMENYLNLPSISTMGKNKSSQAVNSGLCSEIYMKAAIQMLDETDRVGVVVGDEMKLKGSIWSSVSSHRMTGFAEDKLNFANVIDAFKPTNTTKKAKNKVN